MTDQTIHLKDIPPVGIKPNGFLSANNAAQFVWIVWGAMFLTAIACIFIYGRNIPMAEDWHMVAPLTGNEPDLLKWLWAQNNEHRIPFPKFILLILLKISHGDFRCGMFLTVFIIGFLAAAFIKVFSFIRGGKTIFADAFFPLILLHIGNWENFFWSWEFTFIISVVLSLVLLMIVIQYQRLLSFRLAIVAGLSIICLPLCGANGLMYAMPTIPWLMYEAYLHFKSKETGASRKTGLVLSVAIAITLITVLAYFAGYVRPAWYPPSPSIFATIKTAAKFMALGLGPIASAKWGISIFIVLGLIVSASVLLLTAVFKSRNAEFRRAVGLVLFLGGNILFALALGYGRATLVPSLGLPMRYVLLAVPSLIICYSCWQLYGATPLSKLVQIGMFVIMIVLLYPNMKRGLGWRNYYLTGTDAVMKDIKDSIPTSELATRNQQFLLHWDKQMLIKGMKQLKQADMGPFRLMKDDPLPLVIPFENK